MHIIETLDKLLKNELSATETYQQTLDILREDAELGDSVALMPIYENHKEAVSSLQAQIRQLGELPLRTQELLGHLGENSPGRR